MSNCIYRTDNHYQSLMLTVAKHLRTWTLISVKSYWTYNLESLRPSPTLLTVPKNHHFITRIPIYIYICIRTYISLLLAVTGRGAGQRNRTKPCRRRIFYFLWLRDKSPGWGGLSSFFHLLPLPFVSEWCTTFARWCSHILATHNVARSGWRQYFMTILYNLEVTCFETASITKVSHRSQYFFAS